MLNKKEKAILKTLHELKPVINEKLTLLLYTHDFHKKDEQYNKNDTIKQVTEEMLLSIEVRL